MKKTALILMTLFGLTTYAQDSNFGIKAGLNYNSNGEYFEDASAAAKDPDGNIGYHVGIFGKFGERIYFRPELVYTKTKSDYDGDAFDMQKLDAPLLVGIKVLGPLNIFGGPSLQYIMDTDFNGITLNNVENDFTVGLNVGAGLDLGNFGIDLRYERGLSNNEAEFVGLSGTGRIDTRPEQLILSLSLGF